MLMGRNNSLIMSVITNNKRGIFIILDQLEWSRNVEKRRKELKIQIRSEITQT